jgi:bifunctional NMN adenylyltransferase/nudix hydrolase
MSKKYDVCVYILRAQPFHTGHLKVLTRACEIANEVVVILGSANMARSIKNPFTIEERMDLLQKNISYEKLDKKCDKIHITKADDFLYDFCWENQIKETVKGLVGENKKIAIIGYDKDISSDKDSSLPYLKSFSEYVLELVDYEYYLDAKAIRRNYFNGLNLNFSDSVFLNSGVVPKQTEIFLELFEKNNKRIHEILYLEKNYLQNFDCQYRGLPYPPVFLTADFCAVSNNHILLVKRSHNYGHGLWAMPGGFLDAKTDKNLSETAVRELKEETGLSIDDTDFAGGIIETPDRDLRGRFVTMVLFKVDDGKMMSSFKKHQNSEILDVQWHHIDSIQDLEMFADHKLIINASKNYIKKGE